MASGGLPVFPNFSVHADLNTTSIHTGRNGWTSWKIYLLPWTLIATKNRKHHFSITQETKSSIVISFTDQKKGIGITNTTEDGSTIPNEYEMTKKSLTDHKRIHHTKFSNFDRPCKTQMKILMPITQGYELWLPSVILKTPTEKFWPKFYKDACLINLEERRREKIPP